MKIIILLNLCIILSCDFIRNEKKMDLCEVNFFNVRWGSFTKNRIVKATVQEAVSESGFTFSSQIDKDSLDFYLKNLKTSSDTLYNIRMYAEIFCNESQIQLYFDKSGLLEYNGKFYEKSDKLIYFLFRSIQNETKEMYMPPWYFEEK